MRPDTATEVEEPAQLTAPVLAAEALEEEDASTATDDDGAGRRHDIDLDPNHRPKGGPNTPGGDRERNGVASNGPAGIRTDPAQRAATDRELRGERRRWLRHRRFERQRRKHSRRWMSHRTWPAPV